MARAGLSRQAVVDLALAVVDDGGPRGFEDLTLAAVAGRAGVAVPSLYKHVGGLADLKREVALVAVRELTEVLRGALATPADADGPHRLGRALRQWALRRPGRYAATQVAAHRDDPADDELAAAGEAAVSVVATALRAHWTAEARAGGGGTDSGPTGAGVIGTEPTGAELVHTVRVFRAALHGFVLLELSGGFGLPEDVDESFDRLLTTLAPRP